VSGSRLVSAPLNLFHTTKTHSRLRRTKFALMPTGIASNVIGSARAESWRWKAP
jgi:hypothetical protein